MLSPLKRYSKSLLGLSIFLLSISSLNASAVSAGTPAPQFELSGPQGNISLADFKGHVVYVDFWASWCGPCRSSFPWMNSMQQKYSAQGFKVIAINVDQNEKDAEKFLSKIPANFSVAFDPKSTTPKAYDVKNMPSSFLIDKNGKIVLEHKGFKESDKAELEHLIQQKLKE